MNTKRLITTSIFALISASTAQAADVMIPHQPTPVTSSTSAFVAPAFTWEGFYLGGQGGGFSSKTDMSIVGKHKTVPLSKDLSPKLSGFEGGLYAGSNIDLGDNFILSIDTDFTWSGQKHTKTITIGSPENSAVDGLLSKAGRSVRSASGKSSPTESAPAKQVSTTPNSAKLTSTASGSTNPAGSTQTKQTTEKVVNTVEGTSQRSSTITSPAVGKSALPTTGAGSLMSVSVKGEGSSVKKAATVISEPVTLQSRSAITASPSSVARSDSSGVLAVSSAKSTSASSDAPAAPALAKAAAPAPVPATPAASAPAKTAAPALAKAAAPAPVPATPAASAPAKTAAPVSDLRETTVPKASLQLARSGSSGSEGNAASGGGKHAQGHGTSGSAAHGSHSHGTGTNPHGSSAHPHTGGANPHVRNPHAPNPHRVQDSAGRSTKEAENAADAYGIEQIMEMASELGLEDNGVVGNLSHTLKQNWAGATRVRIGFAADRFMPYVAGGVAYTQLQDTVSVSVKRDDGTVVFSKDLTDETKTMVGYTIGGGVDFAMLDNVILRAEYRYSDFGKKKFAKEKLEIKYTTNDFRVGVAYKF